MHNVIIKVWCLLVVLGSVGLTNTVQANSNKLVNPVNNHSYQRFDTHLDWNAAKNACISLGGYLATITNQAENDWVVSNLGTNNQFWIGGTDEAVEGAWVWVTGEPWSYTNWSPGEPNNCCGGENYLGMYAKGKWNDFSVGDGYVSSYLCEWTAYGDANGDGNINSLDLIATTNQILGISTATGDPDCNQDKQINSLDLICIVNKILYVPACSYSISPTSQSFTKTGGTGSINVTTSSGCTWTAQSAVNWATITLGASGTGNGKVEYSVTSNSGADARSTTININDKTLKIQQDGSGPGPGEPRFTVGRIIVWTTNICPGSTFDVTVTVRNEGSAGGDAGSLRIHTSAGDSYASVGWLNAGQDYDVRATGIAPSYKGNWSVRAYLGNSSNIENLYVDSCD